jgi:hypothetical protein
MEWALNLLVATKMKLETLKNVLQFFHDET